VAQTTEVTEDHSVQGDKEDSDDDEPVVENPWNAVCTLGLRVYSKSSETTVEVATPSDAEGASLEVNSDTAAGATA
jgi:hypothetical protein